MKPANFKKVSGQVAIAPENFHYILSQIKLHVPEATIWAFGSRIKKSHRKASDLDLAVLCDKEMAKKELPKLNDIFIESDLPFKVQLLDFNRLPENMQENIKKNYVILYSGKK